MRFTILALSLIMSSGAFAKDLCKSDWSDFQTKLQQSENRLTFRNPKGPMGIGLCWWHSRMTRNAAYLLDFHPEAEEMSEDQAWKVIKALSSTDQVIPVNGYKNLSDFSKDYAADMEESLGEWQMAESFFQAGWANGINGGTTTDPQNLKNIMDETYERVNTKKEAVYEMLKMPGLEAHAWIVLAMEKNPTGYILSVIDSNTLWVDRYQYRTGDTHFRYYGMYDFVPHVQRTSDFADYHKAISSFCASEGKKTTVKPIE